MNEKTEEIKTGVKERLFSCDDCNKNYKLVKELTIHLSSYDHHHTKRLKDMNATARALKKGGNAKKREAALAEKDLQRMLACAKSASAITQAKPVGTSINRMQLKGPIKLNLMSKIKFGSNKVGSKKGFGGFSFKGSKKATNPVKTKVSMGKGVSKALKGKRDMSAIFGGAEETRQDRPAKKVQKINSVASALPMFVKQAATNNSS